MSLLLTCKDVNILKSILDKDDKTKGRIKSNGTSVNDIKLKTDISDKKIRLALSKFIEAGYLIYGISVGRSKTYCITSKGIEMLVSLDKDIISLEEGEEDNYE